MKGLIISSSPHIMSKKTARAVMADVLIALLPALFMSVFIFGLRILFVALFCAVFSVLVQYAFEKVTKREVEAFDLSAMVTGLLLAFNLPPEIPIYEAALGCIFAIIVVKELFGGIGRNFANPAITARIFMLIAFPAAMTKWTYPTHIDAITEATPLEYLADGEKVDLFKLLFGFHAGCIGETSAFFLIIGGIYLAFRRVIHICTPLSFIGTVFILSFVYSGFDLTYAVAEILSGGLILGAFFMATDYSSTPLTVHGKIIFSVGCALITFLIRKFGVYSEGVSFAILLLNILTPYIDKVCERKVFGAKRRVKV